MGDAVFGNEMPRQLPVPARHHHHGRPQGHAGVQQHDDAGDVKHGHHAQGDVLVRAHRPQAAGQHVVHDAAVQMHAAFGLSGGAAGVGQQRQIVGAHDMLGRSLLAGQGLGPRPHFSCREFRQLGPRQQPGPPAGGEIARLRRIKGIGVMRHDQVRQAAARWQGVAGLRHVCGQVGGDQGHPRVRVGDVVLQLVRAIHGVDRHHHGIGPQNGKVRHHQLRAVLHVQQHPVPAPHPQAMQMRRQSLDLVHQSVVAQGVA